MCVYRILKLYRDSLLAMEELYEAIAKELDSLDSRLLQKMKTIISLSPQELSHDVDLSCLSVVKQVSCILFLYEL